MSSTTPPTSTTDERAIANLMVEYAYLNDDLDISGLGDLFAEASFSLDEVTVQGREQIEALAASIIERGDDGRSTTAHELTNVSIDVASATGTATARAYWTLYAARSAQPRQALLSGRYTDSFVKRDGTWYFSDRIATTLWHA